MDKQQSQQDFNENYKLGISKRKAFVDQILENKHGIDNPVEDLNIHSLNGLDPIPEHTFLGNTTGSDSPPSPQDLGINTVFRTLDGFRVTVVNGLVTIATSTSTSSSSSSSSSITTSSSSVSTTSSSSSSSSVSTSSSSSS